MTKEFPLSFYGVLDLHWGNCFIAVVIKAGFHLCDCGRATRVIDRKQSREPVARLRDQWLEHAYQVIIVESKQSDWLCSCWSQKS